ncbi:hypothetical protein BD309DRAFT_875610, partial [Dichomitus squalens]
ILLAAPTRTSPPASIRHSIPAAYYQQYRLYRPGVSSPLSPGWHARLGTGISRSTRGASTGQAARSCSDRSI